MESSNASNTPDIMETCKKMHKTIKKMEKTLSSCIPVEAPITKVATKSKKEKKPIEEPEKKVIVTRSRGRPPKLDMNSVVEMMEGGKSSYGIQNGSIVQKPKRGRPPKKSVENL